MSMAIIILLPILTGFGLLYWASEIEDRLMKLFFRILFLPLVLLSIHFAIIDATIVYGSNTELIKTLADFVTYTGWIIFIFGAYLCYTVIAEVYQYLKLRREQKHGDVDE